MKPATQRTGGLNEVEITQAEQSGVEPVTVGTPGILKGSVTKDTSRFQRTAVVFLLSIALASCASHALARWLKISHPSDGSIGIYRRVGPETGPQALAAGSSLLVSALSWSEVSAALGQGIETWGVGGSSPEIWEVWQQHRPRSTTTIIGVSLYDLNEMHVADERATVVPLSRTIRDLWASQADPDLSHRILAQFGLKYMRVLFPTAGNSDKVLVALRSKAARLLGRRASLQKHEGVVVEPTPPLLAGLQTTASVNDWSSGHLMRRIAILRAENRGRHDFFHGPKNRAFRRMLIQARQQGRVIVVVLPVSTQYAAEFLDGKAAAAFEKAIQEAMAAAPGATLVRLDHVPGISNPAYFFDLLHMNSEGRRVATEAFVMAVTKAQPAAPDAASPAPTIPDK